METIENMNTSEANILSLDMPSGIWADTGKVKNNNKSQRPMKLLTFIMPIKHNKIWYLRSYFIFSVYMVVSQSFL